MYKFNEIMLNKKKKKLETSEKKKKNGNKRKEKKNANFEKDSRQSSVAMVTLKVAHMYAQR